MAERSVDIPVPLVGDRSDLVAALLPVSRSALETAAACLFASASLKNDASEGGLTEEQAALVRGWKRRLLSVAWWHLADFARAASLVRAHGGDVMPARTPLTGEPFTEGLLARLSERADRAGAGQAIDAAAAALSIATVATGPIAGDEPDTADPAASLAAIRTEFLAEAGRTDTVFDPVRPVVSNPTIQDGQSAGGTPLGDGYTRTVAGVCNDAWDLALITLTRLLPAEAGAQAARTAHQLLSSVVRPLGEALTRLSAGGAAAPGMCAGPTFADLRTTGDEPAQSLVDEGIWRLAKAATTARLDPAAPAELLEATAAAQELAIRLAPQDGPSGTAARLAELRALQAGLPAGIQVETNGAYLVTNVADLRTGLGEPITTPPQVALCRCGQSQTKPFCDGTHARVDFTGAKDPNRVPDRREGYQGLQLTIFDNRGLCAHSGFCTDRLSTVFRVDQEPFVAPSGGRMDDIIRAVRNCPSGALSYAIDGQEARTQVDQDRPASIEVSKDGPYRITGSVPLVDGQGADVPRNTGASREHYSLCRCGHSQNKPFCSGMHWYINFKDPTPPDFPTLFQWSGGLPALLRMTRLFYGKYVPEDPLLGPLFADMSPDHPERVAAWLGEVFGGPKYYTEQYGGYTRMISQHLGKAITEAHRARWSALLQKSAAEAGLPGDPEFAAAFIAYLEWGSRIAVENSSVGAHPPEGLKVPRWWWVCEATPGARVSAVGPQVEEKPVELPGEDVPLSFAEHIKPLFRNQDRQSMSFAFDLWSHADVTKHAAGILARLRNGSMPCDGAWPQDRLRVFERWTESGMPA